MHFKISYLVALFIYAFQIIGLKFFYKEYSLGKFEQIINIVYISIIDLFLLSLWENIKVLIVLLGVIIIVYSIFAIVKYFLFGNVLIRIFLILDCIFLFISTVFVIYNLPYEYQNIALTLATTVFSGIITLVGVAWTIKDGTEKRNQELLRIENDRKEDERIKHIPYVKITSNEEYTCFAETELMGEVDINNPQITNFLTNHIFYGVSFENFLIKNISSSNIILEGIKIDKYYYPFKAKILLEVNSCCKINLGDDVYFSFPSRPMLFEIFLKDIIGNSYKINCIFGSKEDCGSPSFEVNKDNEDFMKYSYTYTIISTDLPVLCKGETV